MVVRYNVYRPSFFFRVLGYRNKNKHTLVYNKDTIPDITCIVYDLLRRHKKNMKQSGQKIRWVFFFFIGIVSLKVTAKDKYIQVKKKRLTDMCLSMDCTWKMHVTPKKQRHGWVNVQNNWSSPKQSFYFIATLSVDSL